ncbi:prolyl oligopeptidase family serine peptidase [uncultured Hyphomonas sp.]|uniref:S9 family peptidase n=1 Tax=uncultured Hyphomonas sp. TaxID=225298 RepID=UPI002AAB711B|nr:prolyl oligopeptidase family serine peptidase [uncultured Hyphomonas sp.]
MILEWVLRAVPGLILLGLVACTAVLLPASAGPKGLTVDALLKMEGFGEARFGPTGRWLVFERIRPYDRFPDYSYGTHAFRKSGHQLWRVDIEAGSDPELLPGIDPAAHAWIESFSPGGTRLAVVQYRAGQLSLSACAMESGACTVFDPVPWTDWTGAYRPVWISEDELVYSALPEGRKAPQASLRAATGAWLRTAWAAAWRGDTVTSDEVRTIQPDRSGLAAPGRLVRANARTGKTSILADGRYADLRLAPGGRWLAALAVSGQRAPEPGRVESVDRRRHHVVLFDLETGTRFGPADALDAMPYSLAWSADGRRLLFFAREDGEDVSDGRFRVIDTVTGHLATYTHAGLDLASERERGFAQRPERAVFLGDGIAVFARQVQAGHEADAKFSPRDIGEAGLGRADWYHLSADGVSEAMTSGLGVVSAVPVEVGENCLLIRAELGLYCLKGDGRRQRVLPAGQGKLRQVPTGSYSTYGALSRPDPGQGALVQMGTGRKTAAVLIGPASDGGPESRMISPPQSDAVPVAGSLAAGAALFRADAGAASELLLVREGQERQVRRIARINAHLEAVSFGNWQGLSYRIENPENAEVSETVRSCLLLPAGRTKGPLPLIVEVYPGIRPRCEASSPILTFPNPNSPYLWSGRGYAYARIALPREMIRTEEGPIAGMDKAVDAGINAILTTGHIDPDRIVLSGFSQGAVSALYVAAHSDRFAAIIARNGWADLTSHYFGSPGIYAVLDPDYLGSEFIRYEAEAGSEFGIGRTPFEDPDSYARNSPVLLAENINAPLLLMHSDMDSFSMSQFDEMYSALLRAGKDARYVRYWGEGHGPSSPANIRDVWDRLDGFLEELSLTPEEVPVNKSQKAILEPQVDTVNGASQ